MGLAVTRIGDMCTGHGPFPPRPNIKGSEDVFVNGTGVHRESDPWSSHCNPVPVCHGSTLAAGSSTVYANGMQLGRIGDPVGCGSACAEGSADVFAGG